MAETVNLKAPKATPMQDHKVVTMGEGLDIIDAAFKGYISGLQLEWLSTSSIKVRKGLAVLPAGGLVVLSADITVSGISLGANQWGHVYLRDNGGTPAAEVVTTAPAAYFGTAYQKTGDATRRYLGSVRTDGSGNILNFRHDPQSGFVRYLSDFTSAPLAALSVGTSTTEATVSLAASVPVTSRFGRCRFTTVTSNSNYVALGNSEDSVSLVPASLLNIDANSSAADEFPLDASQALTYKWSGAPAGAGAGLYVFVLGYRFER